MVGGFPPLRTSAPVETTEEPAATPKVEAAAPPAPMVAPVRPPSVQARPVRVLDSETVEIEHAEAVREGYRILTYDEVNF